MVTGDSRADFPQGAGTAGDAAPDYVIIGDAGDEFTYGSLNTAFRDLMNGSDLIALEKDRYWMDTDGLSLSAGPFVSALEYATGKTAVLMGKPSAAYFELALGDMGVRREEAVMIGDDIRTDVGGAQASGMRAVLVRTGKYRDDVLAGSGITPDLVIDSVAMVRRVIEADQGNRWRRRV